MTTGTAIEATVSSILLLAVVYQLMNLLKTVTAKDWKTTITHVVVVAMGWAVGMLFGASTHFGAANLPGLEVPLSELSAVDMLIVALALYGASGLVYDWRKARDNSDTAVNPPLIP